MVNDARSFLDSIKGYVNKEDESSTGSLVKPSDVTVRLATVDPAYSGGLVNVIFDGEEAVNSKGYAWDSTYTPVAGDRVFLLDTGSSYIVGGSITTTAVAPEPEPVFDDSWHFIGDPGEPQFQNGYSNDPGKASPLKYKQDITGRFWLAGVITGYNNGAAIFDLPPSMRPTADIGGNLVFWQDATPSRYGEVIIYASGNVIFWRSGNAGGTYITINLSWTAD